MDAPRAVNLLRLLAFLAPEPVPLDFVLDSGPAGDPAVEATLGPLPADPLLVPDAVAALRRYSLVTLAGNGLVQVHRLVQAVISDQLTEQEADRWKQAAAALVEAAVPANPELPANWPNGTALLPHARAVLDLTSIGLWQSAQALGYSGSYAAARDLFRMIAAAHRDSSDHGPEHSWTLAARATLAGWSGEAGDPAGARDQLAALLPVRERVSGPEHPDTLIARGNLARLTGKAGDAEEARDQFAALVPVWQRVSGPEHPNTLIARANLARWSGRQGTPRGHGTSSQRCCRSVRGSPARSTPIL
jgi:Tetratricopeptide repeat